QEIVDRVAFPRELAGAMAGGEGVGALLVGSHEGKPARCGDGGHVENPTHGGEVAPLPAGCPVGTVVVMDIRNWLRIACAAVAALQLVGEHRLSLDDSVERWLPGVVHCNGNDGAGITVRELLRHTSGLHNYTDDLLERITSVEAYREFEFHQFSRQDLLDIAF